MSTEDDADTDSIFVTYIASISSNYRPVKKFSKY